MNTDEKAAYSGVALVLGLVALVAYQSIKHPQPIEEVEEVAVMAEPLNGVFQCEYYKNTAQHIPNISNYEVFPDGGEWMWTLHLHDGTALFYSQSAGQFCYVHHLGEE